MNNNTPSAYFERAKALQEMILNAQEDLKQLRIDALEELGVADMAKGAAAEIRKDLAEVFAVAKIEVKGEIERRNQAAKMARRKRIAEECGVQLDLLDDGDAGAARRMAGAAVAAGRMTPNEARCIAGLEPIPIASEAEWADAIIANGGEKVGPGLYKIDLKKDDPPHDPETGEIADDEDEAEEVPAVIVQPADHGATFAGMTAAEHAKLHDVPDFLRRT